MNDGLAGIWISYDDRPCTRKLAISCTRFENQRHFAICTYDQLRRVSKGTVVCSTRKMQIDYVIYRGILYSATGIAS